MQRSFCDWCKAESEVGDWTLKLCRVGPGVVARVSFEICPNCEEAIGVRGRDSMTEVLLSELVATLRERAKSPHAAAVTKET